MHQQAHFQNKMLASRQETLPGRWFQQDDAFKYKFCYRILSKFCVLINFGYKCQKGKEIDFYGQIIYKNGYPLHIPQEYLSFFEDYIKIHHENIQIHFDRKNQNFFEISTEPISVLMKQTHSRELFLQIVEEEIKNMMIVLEEVLIALGFLKNGNKKAKKVKEEELKLKRRICECMKKNTNFFTKATSEKKEVLLRSAVEIVKVEENKEENVSQGGYCIVRNDNFEVKEENNGEVTIFQKQLAYKQRKNMSKQMKTIKAKLEKELKIVSKIENTQHFLTYWKQIPTEKIYMEYFPQNLKSKIKTSRFCISDLIDILKQIIASIYELHKSGVVHRDIKAENFLITEKDGKYFIKLIDFGESVMIHEAIEDSILPLAYTLPYSPFQCIKSDEMGTKMKQIDYWSVGMLTYEFIYKKYPFTYGDFVGPNIIQNWISSSSEFQIYLNKRRKTGIRVLEQMGSLMAQNCLKVKQRERINLNQMGSTLEGFEWFLKQLKS